MTKRPKASVFISYCHADKPLAQALAFGLRGAGLHVWIDEGELRAGDSIIERIATAIAEVHFVVAIVSRASVRSAWCRKELALAMTGGLGREGVKVLPLRLGSVAMPDSLGDTFYRAIDPDDIAGIVDALVLDVRSHLRDVAGTDPGRPPRATKRATVSSAAQRRVPTSDSADGWETVHATGFGAERARQARAAGLTPAGYAAQQRGDGRTSALADQPPPRLEPVRIVDIVREGVGRPRNDGTRGSALYAVPFRLSRSPSPRWAQLFQRTWDHPPRFTTMHRPGICSVNGDVVTLDGVTMEEVEKYHLETLRVCLDHVNSAIATLEAREAAEALRQAEQTAAHEAVISDTIGRLRFD